MGKTSRELLEEEKACIKEQLQAENLLEPVETALDGEVVQKALDKEKVTFTTEAIKFNNSFPKEFQWDTNRIIHWVNSVWPEITEKVKITFMKSTIMLMEIVQKITKSSDTESEESYRQMVINTIKDEENLKKGIQIATDGIFGIYQEKLMYAIYDSCNK
jgi:hypothetical protein